MKLKIPIEANTPEKKIEWCYIAQEKLQTLHNAVQVACTNGVISRSRLVEWLRDDFSPRSGAISTEILKNRPLLPGYSLGSQNDRNDIVLDMKKYKTSVKYSVDLNRDFE